MASPVLNKVRERLFFLSPTVQAGWELESKKEDFEELKILGQGAFGLEKKLTHKKTKIIYAIKIVEKAMLKKTDMVELIILRLLSKISYKVIILIVNQLKH